VDKPLQTRTTIANRRFGLQLTVRDFRSVYRRAKITVQKLLSTKKPARIQSEQEQLELIKTLQETFKWHMAQGKHMIQHDAAIFSVKQYARRAWAPSGDPLTTISKYFDSELVVVWGAISVEKGWVLWDAKQQRSFKTEDTLRYFKQIGRKYDGLENVLFGDNAKFQKNARVEDWCAENDLETLWNIAYTPQSNGIERVWMTAKQRYRKELARLLVNRERFDNLALVKTILEGIDDEHCRDCAMFGWRNLMNLKPRDHERR
jgi:hypothetical protein